MSHPYIDHISSTEFVDSNIHTPVFPDGMSELVIRLEGSFLRNNGSKEEIVKVSHIIGPKSRKHIVATEDDVKTITVRLKPGALYALTGIDASEIIDNTIPASEVFGKSLDMLTDKILRSTDLSLINERVCQFISDRLKPDVQYNYVSERIKQIYADPANVTVNSLVSEKGDYYKKLERQFLQVIGYSPAKFILIARLNYATTIKSRSSNLSLSQVAYHSGFYDQAHFTNSFRTIYCETPSQYFQLSQRMVLNNQAVLNNQFGNRKFV